MLSRAGRESCHRRFFSKCPHIRGPHSPFRPRVSRETVGSFSQQTCVVYRLDETDLGRKSLPHRIAMGLFAFWLSGRLGYPTTISLTPPSRGRRAELVLIRSRRNFEATALTLCRLIRILYCGRTSAARMDNKVRPKACGRAPSRRGQFQDALDPLYASNCRPS